ncbi:MAG: hypothetical protein Q7S26_04310 [bacterium]|nr:hypothetical protein [bacterium]
MSKVTIQKNEYQSLKRQSTAYRKLAGRIFEAVVKDDIVTVVQDFAHTNLYSKEFLAEFESGLRKSTYGKA